MRGTGRWTAVLLCAALAGCAPQEGEREETTPARQEAGAAPGADTPPVAPPEARDTEPWIPAMPETIPSAAQASPQAPQQQGGEWTTGVVRRTREGLRPVVLREIRTARHERWDRVVFEFEGNTVPGYHLEYVDRPVRRCGSGKVAEVAGDGLLEVRLTPARAHTGEGRATVEDRERALSFPLLRELEVTCDFEADVTVVLGVASPNPYRVLELSDPARVVVDVKH